MSFGKNKSKSNQTSQSYLDPSIVSAQMGNISDTKNFIGSTPYRPLTGSQIQGFESPYTDDVVNKSLADLNHQQGVDIAGNHSAATAAHAFGGSGAQVADALTQEGYARQGGLLAATLRNQGFDTALGAAQHENDSANQYPLLLRQILNQAYGILGNPVLNKSQGTSSGSGFNFSTPQVSIPVPGA